MPKQLLIDPADVRRPGRLEFRSIPVTAYRGTAAEARIEHGDDGLVESSATWFSFDNLKPRSTASSERAHMKISAIGIGDLLTCASGP